MGWPVLDNFDLRFVHLDAVRANDESEEVCGVGVEFAFLEFGEQIVLTEAAQNFTNVFPVLRYILEVC